MKICLSQGSSGSIAWDQILYMSTLLWNVIWGTGVKDTDDVGCRMHSLSIVVLQVHTPEHSLKQRIYYLKVSVCQKSRSSLLACLSLRVSQEAANKSNAGLCSPQGWTHSGGCWQPLHPHWLLADDICSLPYGPLHKAHDMAGSLPQKLSSKREIEREKVSKTG